MKKHLILTLLFITLLVSSCGKKQIARKYYMIALATPAAVDTLSIDMNFDYRVDIRDFRVARAFDQTRIAMRTETHELKYFYYHHWAVKPAYAIGDMVYDIFEQKQIFRYISRGLSYNPDYIITGEVRNLERVQNKSEDQVHVHLIFRLEQAGNVGRVLVRLDADVTRIMQKDQSMNRFAAIVSDIIFESSIDFMDKVSEHFRQQ